MKKLSKIEIIDAINRFFKNQGKQITNLGLSNIARLKEIINQYNIDLNESYKLKKTEQERILKDLSLTKQENIKKPITPINIQLTTTKRSDIGKEEKELTEEQKKEILEVSKINRAFEKEQDIPENELKSLKDELKKIKDKLPPILSKREMELPRFTIPQLKQIAKDLKIKTNFKLKEDLVYAILKKEGIEAGFREGKKDYYNTFVEKQYNCLDPKNQYGLLQLTYKTKQLEQELEKAKSEGDKKKIFKFINELADVATDIEKCQKILDRDIKKEYEKDIDERIKVSDRDIMKEYEKDIDKRIKETTPLNTDKPKKPEPKKPEPKKPEPDSYKEIIEDWTDNNNTILFFQSKESNNITKKIEELSSKDKEIIPMQLFRLNKDLLNDLVEYRINLKMKPKKIIKEITEGMANYINYISEYKYDMDNALDNFDAKALNAKNKKYIGVVKNTVSADELKLLKTYKKQLEKMNEMKKRGIFLDEDLRPEIEKIIKDLESRLKLYGEE